jgi:uncharacterized protein
MSYYDSEGRGTSRGMGFPPSTSAAIDEGLRAHMQRVYGYMAGGLALTGIVAYAAAASGFYQSIASTPLIWLVMLAPLGFVLALSFGIQRMSAATAMLLFSIYAAVMGCRSEASSWCLPAPRLRACSLSRRRPTAR